MRSFTLAAAVALCLGLPVVAGPPKGAKVPVAARYDAAKVRELEGRLAKKPADARLKSQVAEANYAAGHAMMFDDNLQSRVKYRGALKYFRRALALNPKLQKAAAEKKQIEDIYKQLGRPVPTDAEIR